jgi:S1-C subfamily serine protease
MLDAVAGLKPGSQAMLKLRRDRKELEVRVTVARRPPLARQPR